MLIDFNSFVFKVISIESIILKRQVCEQIDFGELITTGAILIIILKVCAFPTAFHFYTLFGGHHCPRIALVPSKRLSDSASQLLDVNMVRVCFMPLDTGDIKSSFRIILLCSSNDRFYIRFFQ